MKKFAVILGLALSAATACAQTAVTLTVDARTVRQPWEGFGFACTGEWHGQNATLFQDAAFATDVVNDLKPAILRLEIPTSFSLGEDLDLNNININNYNWNAFQPNIQFVQRAFQANPNIKLFATVWSPPPWMKTNNSESGGKLRTDRYQHFAKYLAAVSLGFQSKLGVPLYGVSPANEPRFANPFHSCVYEPEDFRDFLVQADWAWNRWNPPAKIIGPENFSFVPSWVTGYAQAIASNPVAKARLDIHGVHGWGTDSWVNDSKLVGWQRMAAVYRPLFTRTWMTESSGTTQDWFGSVQSTIGNGSPWLARNIIHAIEGGGVNAYVYWLLNHPDYSSFESLMFNGEKAKKYSVFWQFSSFIRPGAQVIASSSTGNPEIYMTSFVDLNQGKLITVVASLSELNQFVPLTYVLPSGGSVSGPVQHWRTTHFQDRTLVDSITLTNNSGPVAMYPYSVNTFVVNYTPPSGPPVQVPGTIKGGGDAPAVVRNLTRPMGP